MRLAVRRVTSGLVCIATGGQFMSGNVHSTIGPQRNKLGEIEMAAKEIVPKTDLARLPNQRLWQSGITVSLQH